MEEMYVKPNPDVSDLIAMGLPSDTKRIVRDLDTLRALPAEGAKVPRNFHWVRLLRDGDVVEAEPPSLAALEEHAERDAH